MKKRYRKPESRVVQVRSGNILFESFEKKKRGYERQELY